MRIVRDVTGVILNVGDIVFRACAGELFIHKILKINRRSLVLSCKKNVAEYNWRNYTYIVNTRTLESLAEQEDKMYFSTWQPETSLVKYTLPANYTIPITNENQEE